MQDDKGHEAATLAAIRAKNLGIELPQWAYDAIVFEPNNAGVICDAVAVQSGLINPPMTDSGKRSIWQKIADSWRRK